MEEWIRINPANADRIAPHFPCGVSIDVHARVMTAIGQLDLSLSDIALLMAEDPMLSQLFLDHVNSAANALRHPVANVPQGVALLGTERLRNFLNEIEHFGIDERQPTARQPLTRSVSQRDRHLTDAGE